jgi:hypothetical protein
MRLLRYHQSSSPAGKLSKFFLFPRPPAICGGKVLYNSLQYKHFPFSFSQSISENLAA